MRNEDERNFGDKRKLYLDTNVLAENTFTKLYDTFGEAVRAWFPA
jgi:hypothetical protein